MKRLYNLIKTKYTEENYSFVGICENSKEISELNENYSIKPIRDKYSNKKTLFQVPKNIFSYIKLFYILIRKYKISGVISTGPGIAIPISLFFKLIGKKIVFIETWSRFDTISLTGRIMYKISNKFYIQNKSLQKYYPDAIYGGLL